jgi:hypothetical protein
MIIFGNRRHFSRRGAPRLVIAFGVRPVRLALNE